MKIFKVIVLASGLAACVVASAADGRLKPGQWDMAISMQMPDMPKMSAAQLAKMKKMGIQMPFGGDPMHIQHCMTPEQASMKQPVNISQGKDGCIVKNYQHSGNTASGNMVCTGDIKGTGKFEMTLNSDTSYTSKWSLQGVSKEGRPINHTTQSSGKWLRPVCDAGIAGTKKQ